MIPINNSDTAWLVVSDYNQENGKYYEDLREDIYNPNVNDWNWAYAFTGVGISISPVGNDILVRVGCIDTVGTNIVHGTIFGPDLGPCYYTTGIWVGGNDPHQQL